MPDPTRETVSSTEVSGLFGVSPWVTEWMLYQRFANGVDIDKPQDDRMALGKHFQAPLLDYVAAQLRLDVEHYPDYVYRRRGVLGASFDGSVTCPTRGPGVVETKWLDWRHWRDTWTFDEADRCVAGPAYYELQVQVEMHVERVEWGLLAAMVGGNDLVLLERVPDPEIIERVTERVEAFMARVRAGDEPPVTGGEDLAIVEALCGTYYPDPPLDLVDDAAGDDLEDLALEYEHVKEERRELELRERALKARVIRDVQLLADGGDPPGVVLCKGGSVRVKKHPDGPKRKGATRVGWRANQ